MNVRESLDTTTIDRGDAGTISDFDVFLFKQGTHVRMYDRLGAHLAQVDGVDGAHCGVWAPNAERVSVVGDFNNWDPGANPLEARWDSSGIWAGFIGGARHGQAYKYHIESRFHGYRVDKADPFGVYCEVPPKTASRLWDLSYEWNDADWMLERAKRNALDAPMSIYEMHLGSWRRELGVRPDQLNYRHIAYALGDYLHHMGFTHVELLPVMEHPFYGSWGYQVTGYFAPTARYGTPQDFMYFVDHLHQRGIGVILDWVPSHFPGDEHGLVYFDGTNLFEHADVRQAIHPEWHSYLFNYGRHEVRSFLASSGLFWLDKYHVDGLRVDAVASMLYLDYARSPGQWVPNMYGGRENLDAISFLRSFNEAVYRDHPDVQTIAEESTAWPMVSRPTYVGGLGFGMKWNMGWMHDTLKYFQNDPLFRRYHHDQLTFSIIYAFSENFVLPLSHDEVAQGKGTLIGKMPGDDWQQFANLRTLFGYMWAHPGKKLLFMGGEFGQRREWQHDESLEWYVLDYAGHAGVQRWVRDLNHLYRDEPALHEIDFSPDGFEWIDCCDSEHSVISFVRKSPHSDKVIVAVFNFTPVPHINYQIGVTRGGHWDEVLNSDAEIYGGSGMGNFGGLDAAPVAAHGRFHCLTLTLPPLAAVFFRN